MRSVRDSVESLKKRAMTAGQLRETIERTIESRIAGLKDMVSRVQDLFKEGAGKISDVREAISKGGGVASEKVDSLAAQLGELGQRVQELGQSVERELNARTTPLAEELQNLRVTLTSFRTERETWGSSAREAIDGVAASVKELAAKIPQGDPTAGLGEQVKAQEERLVAWLERLNVQGEKEAAKAAEERSQLRDLLAEAVRSRADMGQLRTQLNRVRGNLSAGLQEVREEVWRSRIARTFLKGRLDTAIEPAQTALSELDAVLKRLADM
jgi:predicted  nucleic acid-binding Zn-ribbon protein